MRTPRLRVPLPWAVAALVLTAGLHLAPAEVGARGDGVGDSDASPRERYERLDPVERERFRARYEAYRAMSSGEQLELTERARNLARMRERLLRGLDAAQRARLMEFDEARREQLLTEMLEAMLREQGRRLRSKLPAEWSEELERATPEERRQFFVRFKERHRPRMSVIAVERLAQLLERDPEEIQRLKRLPERERLTQIVALRKELNERAIEEGDLLPVGLTEERWREVREWPPEAFFEEVLRIQALQQARVLDAPAPEAGGAESDVPTLPERRRAAALQLLEALAPLPAERLELALLPPEEREVELSKLRRARLQSILEAHQVVPPEMIEEFAGLPDGEFYVRIRRLVRDARVDRETVFERRRMQRLRRGRPAGGEGQRPGERPRGPRPPR